MDQDLKGWYTERSPMWPGQAFSLKVKHKLLDKHSKFQHIEIFESTNHGKVLVLDGAIQFTEKDEASYQEMITFLPVNAHPNPRKVLVVGGGDGGVVRELWRHPAVKEVVQCEIDEEVVQACRTHVPSLSCGFDNPGLTLHTGDGAKFLEETQDKFDVIITDASDPEVSSGQHDHATKDGPAASLFNEGYFIKMRERLSKGGILCCQGENMWQYRNLVTRLVRGCRQLFPVVEYAITSTPTYITGQISFILCSADQHTNLRKPLWVWDEKKSAEMGLKYYNAAIHQAAFVLPNFMWKLLTPDPT